MEIYVDVLFAINLVLDFLLIQLTADVLSVKIKPFRALLVSVLGGIFGVCFFIPDLSFAGAAVTSVIEGAAIIFAAFGICRPKEFLKRLGVMYAGAMFFAGLSMLDMLMFGGGMVKNGIFYVRTPRLILSATFLYIVVKFCISKLKRRASVKISCVVLEYMGKKVFADALTDTGNGLTDPFTQKPVMLIKLDILQRLISKDCGINNLCEWVERERIRMIPYHTIDSEGFLTGIILDRIMIDGRTVENAIAAISDRNLKYPVILHAGM